jgi:thioredoxin-related protein
MKNILLAFFLLLSTLTIQAQEIKWLALDEALARQKKNPKPIFMEVYTDWYEPCKLLDNNTFKDPTVIDVINRNYYPVKFNAEGNSKVTYKGVTYDNPNYDPNRKGRNSGHEFIKFLQVGGYPSMYILDKNGNVIQSIVGYKTHEELLKIIK